MRKYIMEYITKDGMCIEEELPPFVHCGENVFQLLQDPRLVVLFTKQVLSEIEVKVLRVFEITKNGRRIVESIHFGNNNTNLS